MTLPACFHARSAGSEESGGERPASAGAAWRRRALVSAAALFLAAAAGAAELSANGNPTAAPPEMVAQAEPGGPGWAELSPPQREVLAPLSGDWNSYDARSKERWLNVASRFHTMPPAEQQRANERMAQWARMTPTQRTQARLNYQEARSVSKEQRQAQWQTYQALPEDQKRALAQRAAAAAVPTAAGSTVAAARRKHPPLEAIQPKTNIVADSRETGTPVEPGSSVLEMRPGATTTLVNRKATPPAHQKDGQPKINAGPNSVDRTTLLPKRGAQAAAAVPPGETRAH